MRNTNSVAGRGLEPRDGLGPQWFNREMRMRSPCAATFTALVTHWPNG